MPEEDINENPKKELYETGEWFPFYPRRRTVKDCRWAGSSSDREEPICAHNYSTKGDMAPGLLLYWCAEHGKCIGMKVLSKNESTESVYTTLVTRFKTMPGIN